MKCEVCGKENSDSALFCAECGKALKDTPISLDLDEINVPAAARKARIVKVNAKKTAEKKETAAPEAAAVQDSTSATAQSQETAAAPESEETPLIDLSTGKATVAEETPAAAKSSSAESAETAAAPLRIIDWIVVLILTAIPVVDVVMLLIWAISSKTNPSKKSFAQATLIFGAVLLVLGVAAYFIYAKFLSTDPVTSWNQFM